MKRRLSAKDKAREKRYKQKYGITEAIFQAMMKAQNGCCAICGKPPKNQRLNIDHDHKTGRVRGLLCFYCNKFLVGRHKEGTLLRKAADYLERDYDARTKYRHRERAVPPVSGEGEGSDGR